MVGVIATGGQQYIVAVGKKFEIKKLSAKPGAIVVFDDMLKKGNIVTSKVIGAIKGEKVSILKFKNKSRYLRQGGHRQDYTTIEIVGIEAKKTASAKGKEPSGSRKAKVS